MIKIFRASLIGIALVAGQSATQAGNVFRADNANNLNVADAWSNSVAPTASDIATWNNLFQINTASTLGADLEWGGIQILDPAGLITINAGNTLTLDGGGIDLTMATNGLSLETAIVLNANQTWAVTNGQTLTADGAISGTGLLTLNTGGTTGGTILLNTANTYTGGTVINSGIIQPGNATSFGPSSAGITNNGATLLFATLPNGGIIASTMHVSGTTSLDMNNRNASVVLDGAFSGNGIIYVTNDTASGSTLTLGGNGSGSGNFNAFTGSIIVVTNDSGTPSAGNIRFNNGGANNNQGNSGMTLDLGSGSIHFTEKNSGTTANFGALYGGPNTELAASEKYVIGALNLDTLFAGTIMGSSTLTKNGTGTLTLSGNNPYTGTTTVNAGAIQVGDGTNSNAGTLGTGDVTINLNGTLIFNKPDDFAFNNNITGGGTLIKNNVSILTYGGNNTSSGSTVVNEGTFALAGGSQLSSSVSLAAGTVFDVTANGSYSLASTLSGFGAVAGALASTGGTIIPGSATAAGTLTFSNGLSEAGNVINEFILSSPGSTNSTVAILGDLSLSGMNNVSLTHFGGGTIPSGMYTLMTYSGVLNGSLTNLSVTAIGAIGTLTNPPGQIAVIITPPARGRLTLAWTGDGINNAWDMTSTNWVNAGTQYTFLPGDSAIFSDVGVSNPVVNLTTTVLPASVVVDSASDYTFLGNFGIAGDAGLLKTNSGTLIIDATNSFTGPVIVGSGVLEVSNIAVGGIASAIGAATSDPTNLVFYGGTLRYSGPAGTTDRGATLNSAGATIDTPGADLTLAGTLTGTGSLTKIGAGNLILNVPNTYSGGTVISNGTIELGANSANYNGASGGALGATNDPVTFYGGTLQLYGYSASTGNNYNTCYNPLIVPTGQSGTLELWPRGPSNSGNGSGLQSSLTGNGTLNLVVNYVRDNVDGDWSAFTGTINVMPKNATGDEFRVNNNYGYANATIILNDNVLMDRATTANSTIDIGELDGTSLAVIGQGNGSAAAPTWRVGWKNTSSTFNGTLTADVSLTKVGTGTLTLTGSNTHTGNTTVSAGTLALSGGGSITTSANIDVQAGAFLDVSALSAPPLSLFSSQVLKGDGTVKGDINSSGGIISPGDGVGTLTVTGNASLAGTIWMEVNDMATPNADKLAASAIDFNYGTLVVTNVGPRLHAGDTFTLFSGSLSGTFNSVILPNYYTWDTNNLTVNGTIKVTGVLPPPALTNVDFTYLQSGNITINAINGAPNGPVTVLMTTNLALPFNQWTPLTTTAFDSSGNLNTTVFVDPTLPQTYIAIEGN